MHETSFCESLAYFVIRPDIYVRTKPWARNSDGDPFSNYIVAVLSVLGWAGPLRNVGPKNCAWVKSMGLKTLVKYNRVLNGLGYPSDEHLYSDETSQDRPIRISHFLSLINLIKLLL